MADLDKCHIEGCNRVLANGQLGVVNLANGQLCSHAVALVQIGNLSENSSTVDMRYI